MEKIDRGYLCAVLQFLLKSDQYSLPLVTLPVHLVDKDNEASLDLLCALFKHCECHENLPDAVSFSIHNTSQHLVYMVSRMVESIWFYLAVWLYRVSQITGNHRMTDIIGHSNVERKVHKHIYIANDITKL